MTIKIPAISEDLKVVYQKPIIIKQAKMVFPIQVMENITSGEKVMCRQCSSCHGCR